MRIVVITQDEPFFLADSINFLISNLPKKHKIVGFVVADVSPFGKKESFLTKAMKTFNIFGARFFLRYTFKFIFNKIFKPSVIQEINSHKLNFIKLDSSINSKESLEKLKNLNPDLLISIAGNEIFKKDLINLAPRGCLNVHTALLPKYRGLMPTFWVLKNNEEFTGVSVFFVDEGIDSGPIIVQKKIKIGNITQEDLIKKTKKIGMDAIIEAVELIENNNVNTIDNNDEEMTYFKFPEKEDVKEFHRIGKRFF
tara:strand:- start:922 stop:1683 length:762 start_codon:yes stop_codon:yes gene_type:complete